MNPDFAASTRVLAPVPGDEQGSGDAQKNAKPLLSRAQESNNPYIRSQQDSLVKWQLLDSNSLEQAKAANKLIFLHVGYKSCHHCRLMSIESFANPECASIINHSFIPVLVDREERPDIDNIYMNYVQAVSNAGGWPLNLFLTADLEPVFGGTYWPGPGANTAQRSSSENEEEILDFLSVLKKVRDVWRDQESRCRQEAKEVLGQLRDFAAEGSLDARVAGTMDTSESSRDATKPNDADELDLDQLEEAYTQIAGTFDPVYGGFGLAPKFLTPPKLSFLLGLTGLPSEVHDVVGEAEVQRARDMALVTLRKIRDGALRDHLGGTGFARCSVTPDWSIPNFERLVVDNALLLPLYLEAWRLGGGQSGGEFYDVMIQLADYLSSPPILLPDGAFASSEAADSHYRRGDKDMIEGAYYLWTRREFDSVIEEANRHISLIAAAHWDVQEDGNIEEKYDPHDDFINQNVLRIVKTADELSKQFNIPAEQVEQYIQTAKVALRARRDKDRIRPELDDKVVAGWNGLVISALARTGVALQAVDMERGNKYLQAATSAASFIKSKLWDSEQEVLFRIWTSAGRQTEGFAEDYAYVIEGLLDLADATHDTSWTQFANDLQKSQITLFYDPNGAFYCTTASSPHTILRLKDGMDTSLPSTNSVSVSNLYRLGAHLNDEKYKQLARETINAFEAEMLQHPGLYPGLLGGVVTARLGVNGRRRSGI
ncbi:hypothetical protein S7711_04878 [Stachybotrys chartarum IBT 7711]|uniref:Spermatogenesis-associated protein 20-like TRX domain-containing protein n=1 Tax=Stachybotrys chartarum (strain CBS 109288 / IBT 7711) TaxID=1280523 RepID=A0A084B6F0_STACB|nr:hypothetical protein S7711_04878 [Stachybotrys chartarum IBT 7711]